MTIEKTATKKRSNMKLEKWLKPAGMAIANGMLTALGTLIVAKLASGVNANSGSGDNLLQLKKQG